VIPFVAPYFHVNEHHVTKSLRCRFKTMQSLFPTNVTGPFRVMKFINQYSPRLFAGNKITNNETDLQFQHDN